MVLIIVTLVDNAAVTPFFKIAAAGKAVGLGRRFMVDALGS